jgi:hypothetical protein
MILLYDRGGIYVVVYEYTAFGKRSENKLHIILEIKYNRGQVRNCYSKM